MDVLISVVITLCILAIVYLIVQKLIAVIGAPSPVPEIVQIIFWLVCLIVLLRIFGVWGGGPYYYFHPVR